MIFIIIDHIHSHDGRRRRRSIRKSGKRATALFDEGFLALFDGEHGTYLFDCVRVVTSEREAHDDGRDGGRCRCRCVTVAIVVAVAVEVGRTGGRGDARGEGVRADGYAALLGGWRGGGVR